MKKIIIGFLVVAALIWSVYAALYLVNESGSQFEPQRVFGIEDETILILQRPNEMQSSPIFQQFNNHPLIASVSAVNWQNFGVSSIFISAKRPLVLAEKRNTWSQNEMQQIEAYFKQNNIQIRRDGKFLIIHQLNNFNKQETKSFIISNKDKNASGIVFNFNPGQNTWEKTEIYALTDGYFEYRSATSNYKVGVPIKDIDVFSAVLPKNIQAYHFYDKFYYQTKDSVFKDGLMLEWLEIGFVKAEYQNQTILVSDYRAQQLPRLVLLEKALEDSILQTGDIASFSGFQLTNFFPSNKNGRFYLVEIEDKTIFTEDKSLAQDILLQYNLGETLLLSPSIAEHFFGRLPQFTNERRISANENASVTIRNNLKVEVITAPLSSEQSFLVADSWTRTLDIEDITDIVAIPDHIRGGTSFFVSGKSGKYVLVNGQNGGIIWSGDLGEKILHRPQVIDLFENDKHQLLLVSNKAVHLLDLNGEAVNGFPYQSNTSFASNISALKWKNSMQFVLGNDKGEIVLINNQGQELNVIQLSTQPIKKGVFAKNVQGKLRVFGIDSDDFAHLGYLETNAAPQRLGKVYADFIEKIGPNVKGVRAVGENVQLWNSVNPSEEQSFATGKILAADNGNIYIQKNNQIQLFDWNGKLQFEVSLGFNEVAMPKFIQKSGSSKILIAMDYLTNKIHAVDENGTSLEGFPKEGRKMLAVAKEKQQLQIVTTINGALVGYLVEL
jgi:hypothetical protein